MMKKKEFLSAVAAEAQTTSKVVDSVIEGIATVTTQELAKGEKVVIPGLVTFTPKFVPGGPKVRRSPLTGETKTVQTEDKTIVKAKVRKSLASLVNEK